MLGVELVADKKSKAPLELSEQAGSKIFQSCLEHGVIVRPVGDRIVISPPLVITRDQCDDIVGALSASIKDFMAQR